jgi:lariat debranching enzyme
LGSPPLQRVLQKLKPSYWFSAHLHVKFPAIYDHSKAKEDAKEASQNPDEILLSDDSEDDDKVTELKEQDKINEKTKETTIEPQKHQNIKYTKFLALNKVLPGRDFLQASFSIFLEPFFV